MSKRARAAVLISQQLSTQRQQHPRIDAPREAGSMNSTASASPVTGDGQDAAVNRRRDTTDATRLDFLHAGAPPAAAHGQMAALTAAPQGFVYPGTLPLSKAATQDHSDDDDEEGSGASAPSLQPKQQSRARASASTSSKSGYFHLTTASAHSMGHGSSYSSSAPLGRSSRHRGAQPCARACARDCNDACARASTRART